MEVAVEEVDVLPLEGEEFAAAEAGAEAGEGEGVGDPPPFPFVLGLCACLQFFIGGVEADDLVAVEDLGFGLVEAGRSMSRTGLWRIKRQRTAVLSMTWRRRSWLVIVFGERPCWVLRVR